MRQRGTAWHYKHRVTAQKELSLLSLSCAMDSVAQVSPDFSEYQEQPLGISALRPWKELNLARARRRCVINSWIYYYVCVYIYIHIFTYVYRFHTFHTFHRFHRSIDSKDSKMEMRNMWKGQDGQDGQWPRLEAKKEALARLPGNLAEALHSAASLHIVHRCISLRCMFAPFGFEKPWNFFELSMDR